MVHIQDTFRVTLLDTLSRPPTLGQVGKFTSRTPCQFRHIDSLLHTAGSPYRLVCLIKCLAINVDSQDGKSIFNSLEGGADFRNM